MDYSYWIIFVVTLKDILMSTCQYLEVPPNGISVKDNFTMKCHFGDTVGDIFLTNWYHSDAIELNQLYTHISGQNGEKKNDWSQRDVTGKYYDTYHEVFVKQAIQDDEKLYICDFVGQSDSKKTASAPLQVHVPPEQGNTNIEVPDEIIEGHLGTFVCKVNSIRPVNKINVKWRIGTSDDEKSSTNTYPEENPDGLFLVTAELSKKFVEDNNGDDIYCRVYWEDLYQYEVSQTMNIFYPPGQAQPDKSIYYATSVSDLEVGCSVNKIGNPQDNTFVFIQTDHTSYTLSSETGKAKIDIFSEERDGGYLCYATNHNLIFGENGTFTVVVTVPPTVIAQPEDNIDVWYKNPLSIVYNVSAKPRAWIVWEFPGSDGIYLGRDDADGHTGDRDLLVITNSHANWASENINNRKQGGGTLNVNIEHEASTDTHSHQINVEYEPGQSTFSLQPAVIDVTKTVELSCSPGDDPGNPAASTYQFKDDDTWTSAKESSGKYSLTIDTVEQEKNYRCASFNVPNSIGNEQNGPDSATEKLTVLVPPAFVNTNGNPDIDISYNDSFTLSCDATGKETVSITWKKNGQDISSEDFHDPVAIDIDIDNHYGLTQGRQSTITRKMFRDHYRCDNIEHYNGEYTCIAQNKDPSGNTRSITSEPYVISTKYSAHWIDANSTVQFAEYNQSFSLECTVCAYPDPSYVWYQTGQKLEDQTNRIYEIVAVGMDDFTEYWCEVDNGIDVAQIFSLWLNESGPPSLTAENMYGNSTSTVVPLTWEILTNGGNPPMNFTIGVKLTNETVFQKWKEVINHRGQVGDQVIVNVDNLSPNTEYDFNITAKNSRATGDPYSESKYVHGRSHVSPIVNLRDVTVENEFMEITWQYTTGVFRRHSFNNGNISVTLCIQYWVTEEGKDSAKTYPALGDCSIEASLQTERIEDNFDPGREYNVELLVYENGYRGSNAGQNGIQNDPITGMGGGAIAGIVISLLIVIALVVVLAVLLQRGVIPDPRKRPREDPIQSFADETSFDETSNEDIHQAISPNSDAFFDDNAVKLAARRIPETPVTNKDKVTIEPDGPFLGNQEPDNDDEPVSYGSIDFSKLVPVEKKPVPPSSREPENIVYADLDLPKREKPQIMHTGGPKYFLNVGETISLTVTVISDTDVNVTWLHGNDDVTGKCTNVVTPIQVTSTLTIENAEKEDSGRFTITAENRYGKATFKLYTVVIGKIDTLGLYKVPSFEDDDFEIFGKLPANFL